MISQPHFPCQATPFDSNTVRQQHRSTATPFNYNAFRQQRLSTATPFDSNTFRPEIKSIPQVCRPRQKPFPFLQHHPSRRPIIASSR
jgi:hypothetical protein